MNLRSYLGSISVSAMAVVAVACTGNPADPTASDAAADEENLGTQAQAVELDTYNCPNSQGSANQIGRFDGWAADASCTNGTTTSTTTLLSNAKRDSASLLKVLFGGSVPAAGGELVSIPGGGPDYYSEAAFRGKLCALRYAIGSGAVAVSRNREGTICGIKATEFKLRGSVDYTAARANGGCGMLPSTIMGSRPVGRVANDINHFARAHQSWCIHAGWSPSFFRTSGDPSAFGTEDVAFVDPGAAKLQGTGSAAGASAVAEWENVQDGWALPSPRAWVFPSSFPLSDNCTAGGYTARPDEPCSTSAAAAWSRVTGHVVKNTTGRRCKCVN